MSIDRDDSLLTKAQRALLTENSEYSRNGSTGRVTRGRMRTRLIAGLKDFRLLAVPTGLTDADFAQIRDKLETEGVLADILREIIAFTYRLRPDAIEQIVEDGVRLGVERYTPEYEVGTVNIPIEKHGHILDQARTKMNNNDPLTEREIRVLLTDGDIPLPELRDYVRSHSAANPDGYGRRFR